MLKFLEWPLGVNGKSESDPTDSCQKNYKTKK